ncbi:MAG: hypothetical protein MJZ59_01000, partial [Paludibacteraceae bacterium]|nr:hypothetical protein [Paludibacteraceae bacterium]
TAEILETVDSLVLVRCASDATEIIWDGEGKNVWNQTANYELCDTMSFVAWVEDTNLFTITCDTPQPVDDGYGILVNGTTYEKGEASDIDGGKEYKVVLDLNIDDFVQLYDGTNHVAWVVDPEGSGYTNFDQHDDALYIKEKGNYQFYVKIFTNMTSGLYVSFASGPTGLIEIMRNAKDGKFIINGNMIIRRNGALYTIQGARL